MNCKQCGASLGAAVVRRKFCSAKCRHAYFSTSYTAADIHVLTDKEAGDAFDWKQVELWANQYKFPHHWLLRACEACRLANVDPREYVLPRYLKGDMTIPLNKEVDMILREIQKKRCR